MPILRGSAELREDLVFFREPALRVLGEEEQAVGMDVELSFGARSRLRVDAEPGGDLGRETRGPRVVSASGRAVEDLDRH
jgi:hypothetical protein